MTLQREKRENKAAHMKLKYPFLYKVEESQLISPVSYSARAGDVERVQHYASVDKRIHLELGVVGERYKPVHSVDRA